MNLLAKIQSLLLRNGIQTQGGTESLFCGSKNNNKNNYLNWEDRTNRLAIYAP